MEKRCKKNTTRSTPGKRDTHDFFFLPDHEHDESWRCVHVDIREVRDNCGFAYAGWGRIMNLSQISGHSHTHTHKRINKKNLPDKIGLH